MTRNIQESEVIPLVSRTLLQPSQQHGSILVMIVVKLVGKTPNGNHVVDINGKVVTLMLGGLLVPDTLNPLGYWHHNSNWGEMDDIWWETTFPELPKMFGYQSNLSEQEKQLRINNSVLYKQICEQLNNLLL